MPFDDSLALGCGDKTGVVSDVGHCINSREKNLRD